MWLPQRCRSPGRFFCHEWCAFSALLCAQGFGRYSAGYWPHACHLNNTGARLHKQHNGPGDWLQYHVVPVSNFNVTEPSYPSHSLAPWLFIPGRRIAKLELLSLDIRLGFPSWLPTMYILLKLRFKTLWSPACLIVTVTVTIRHRLTSIAFFDQMPSKYDAESCRNGIYVKFYVDIVSPTFFSIELR